MRPANREGNEVSCMNKLRRSNRVRRDSVETTGSEGNSVRRDKRDSSDSLASAL